MNKTIQTEITGKFSMRFTVLHELPDRLRIKLFVPEGYSVDLDKLKVVQAVKKVSFNSKTANLLISHDGGAFVKKQVLKVIDVAPLSHIRKITNQPVPIDKKKNALIVSGFQFVISPLLPLSIRAVTTLFGAAPFFRKGIIAILMKKLNTDVLDGAAIGAAMGIGDFRTAGIISLLLKAGDYLDEWTKDRSKRMLTGAFQIGDDRVWVKSNGHEHMIMTSKLKVGDSVIVRAGSRIPVDGVVIEGEAMVNQASMTGESLPVMKRTGITVYAGTALEEGMLIIKSRKVGDETTVSKIAHIISEGEHLKADIQSHAETIADRLVPYTLLLTGVTYALTGNAVRALSVLLIDFSCALKLSTPLGIMAGMIKAAKNGVVIKGGKFIERLSNANTFVLDKTGTLTEGCPSVTDVISFNGYTDNYVLKHAACVEEHFPHPVATAIVKKARTQGLIHDEEHTEVEYIAAHGIVSSLNGKKIIVGSKHFILEDRGIDVKIAESFIEKFESCGLSMLYVAIDDNLAGLIIFQDPLRDEASDFIINLRNSGVEKILMLTGDTYSAAKSVAERAGLTEYHSQILPDRKTEIIKSLKKSGAVVAMVGDGINDSPALSYADVGISMKHGADIAKEACDVLLLDSSLMSIILARKISSDTLNTLRQNFKYIMGINSSLIVMGLAGISTLAFSAFMHNAATVLSALNSMKLMRN